MVFQSYALYPHLTVRDNIGFALSLAKLPKEVIAQKVDAAAVALQLTPLLDRKPKALFGGQRQRVAIGRAIVRNPRCSSSRYRSRTWTPPCTRRCGSSFRTFTASLVPR